MKILSKRKVFLVDDHTILREGLKVILEKNDKLEIIGQESDGKVALERIEREKPELVILDISLPSMTGIEIARQIKKFNAQIKVVILSRHDNQIYVKKLLDMGVDGYVLKQNAADDLNRAIEASFKGQVYLSPSITGHVLSALGGGEIKKSNISGDIFATLTNRERQILKLLAEGNSNQDIADMLFISPATVKTHRINLMRKLDIHKIADLVAYAIKNGLVDV